jgi:hypothetical protein
MLSTKIYLRATCILVFAIWICCLMCGLADGLTVRDIEFATLFLFGLISAIIVFVVGAPAYLVYSFLLPALCRLTSDKTERILLAILAAFLSSFTHTIILLLLYRNDLYWGPDNLYMILISLGLGTIPASIAILTCHKQFVITQHF